MLSVDQTKYTFCLLIAMGLTGKSSTILVIVSRYWIKMESRLLKLFWRK